PAGRRRPGPAPRPPPRIGRTGPAAGPPPGTGPTSRAGSRPPGGPPPVPPGASAPARTAPRRYPRAPPPPDRSRRPGGHPATRSPFPSITESWYRTHTVGPWQGNVMLVETDLLGAPYQRRVIDLGEDDEGPVVATLVSRPAREQTRRAVLWVHGFSDYFFQTHVADFFTDQGFDFYALDLRKYGRSLRAHQTPNFCRSLGEY